MTPWVVASVILHILIILLYPEWQASALNTPSPVQDGVMQVSFRTFQEQLDTPALRRATGPQPTVNAQRPDPDPLPERAQQPVDQAPIIAPSPRPESARPPLDRVAEIQPEILPERFDRASVEVELPERVVAERPSSADRPDPVESPQPLAPQAPPEPQKLDIRPPERGNLPIPVSEALERTETPEAPQNIEKPEHDQRPEDRSLPEVTRAERPAAQPPPAAPSRPEVEAEAQPELPSLPVAPQPGSEPQRPMPPPTYGASLQFPKPGTVDPPKRMVADEAITVSVLITFDDRGDIIAAELIEETAADDSAVNNEAPQFARHFVEITQPAPAGHICQAVVQVTFDQVAGTTFAFNEATDRVQCLMP